MSEPKSKDKTVSRRDFFGRAGIGAFALATTAGIAGLGRAVVPRVTPDPAQTFKIGIPQDYPEGTTINFEDEHVIVFRDHEGFYAISTVCTHLGCIVHFDAETGFECPCHGSKFHPDGRVARGPAPAALPWLEMSVLPNGQVAVNRGRQVAAGTKMTV